MSDLKTLEAAEQANRNDYHWSVGFIVKMDPALLAGIESGEPCPHCGQVHDEDDEDIATIAQTATVAAGEDGQEAVERIKAHVYDEAQFGVKVVPDSFKLQGLKLLSVKDI